MNEKQRETYKRLIKEHGKPISEWENKFLNVYFLDYTFGSIGIEQDGYSHM